MTLRQKAMTSSVLIDSPQKGIIRSLPYYSHRYQKCNKRVQQRPLMKSENHEKNYLPSWFYVTRILEISRFWGAFFSITADLHALGFVRSGTYIP